jgi:FkbM family methyltransferase
MEVFDQMVRSKTAAVLTRLPWFRGKGRIAAAINRRFPSVPSNAIAVARMRLGYEMAVDLRSQTEFLAYYTGEYDTQTIRGILRLVEPDWVIFDVGANIGFWTIPLACAIIESGSVHCFEPIPSNFRRLTVNIERNHVAAVVRAHNFGLSDRNRTAQISLREDFVKGAETGNAAIVIDDDDSRFQCVQIDVRTLDDLFGSLDVERLDFMKIDIEGHEQKFLTGAAQTIARFRPIIFTEINDPYYERQGLDATVLFQNWLAGHSYVVAFRRTNRWELGDIASRSKGLSDVFFLPAEKARETIARLRNGA